MIAQLGDFFAMIINWMRGLPVYTRSIIVLVGLAVGIWLIAKSLRTGKDSEKKPIRWLYLGMGIILVGIAIFFSVIGIN